MRRLPRYAHRTPHLSATEGQDLPRHLGRTRHPSPSPRASPPRRYGRRSARSPQATDIPGTRCDRSPLPGTAPPLGRPRRGASPAALTLYLIHSRSLLRRRSTGRPTGARSARRVSSLSAADEARHLGPEGWPLPGIRVKCPAQIMRPDHPPFIPASARRYGCGYISRGMAGRAG